MITQNLLSVYIATYHKDDDDDNDGVESDVGECEYDEGDLVGQLSPGWILVQHNNGDNGVPYTDAAQYAHRSKNVLVLHQVSYRRIIYENFI